MANKPDSTPGTDIDLITGEVLPEIEDSTDASRSIVESILAAEDMYNLFRSRGTIAAKDLLGKPLRIVGVSLRRGEIDGTPGVWMLIDAYYVENGEQVMVNTGARNIMATLLRAQQLGALPVEVQVVKVGRAKQGQSAPLGLAPYGKTAEQVAKAAPTP